jgi:uncharacterized heparinase superfamily protein
MRVTGTEFKPKLSTCHVFKDSGYYVMSPATSDKLIVDCGAVGPEYQPGHAHCDTLSFELSLAGRRVVVDSGCYQYPVSEIRSYNRGNKGHNTLTIDGRNQSEVWHAHRCGRRAYPIDPKLDCAADGTFVFTGGHDGYKRLKGKPVHFRHIAWKGRRIVISDHVRGSGRHDLYLRLHINPDLVVDLKNGIADIRDGEWLVMMVTAIGAAVTMEQGWYCPEFGKKIVCPVLVATFSQVGLPFETGWIFEIVSAEKG